MPLDSVPFLSVHFLCSFFPEHALKNLPTLPVSLPEPQDPSSCHFSVQDLWFFTHPLLESWWKKELPGKEKIGMGAVKTSTSPH